ncbi:MAG TPA: protein phosphatase 2C domain-containing protein [Methanospirillum sp.]|nr:protein phosphatase 2C domain-containing protein [Methanospirillum sp.]
MIHPVCCSYITHRGYHRSENEDSILVSRTVIAGGTMESPRQMPISTLPALFCVADGIGGAAYGEVASRTVMEIFAGRRVPQTPEEIIRMIIDAKEVLDDMALKDPTLTGFGTTIAGLVLFQDHALVFNCGDSRVYQIDSSRITRISHDHSYVQELCDQGIITHDQVYYHPERNIITSSISGDLRPPRGISVFRTDRTDTDRFLLCTDGVWEVVRDEELALLCRETGTSVSIGAVLKACLEGGGPDNISGILLGNDTG